QFTISSPDTGPSPPSSGAGCSSCRRLTSAPEHKVLAHAARVDLDLAVVDWRTAVVPAEPPVRGRSDLLQNRAFDEVAELVDGVHPDVGYVVPRPAKRGQAALDRLHYVGRLFADGLATRLAASDVRGFRGAG